MRLPVRPMEEEDWKWLILDAPGYEGEELLVRRRAGGTNLVMLSLAGERLACGGMQPFWPGVAEAWLYVCPSLQHEIPMRERVSVVRTLRYWLYATMGLYGYWRVQAAVLTDYQSGCRLMEALGFRLEGVMRQFDPVGRDANLYALIKE